MRNREDSLLDAYVRVSRVGGRGGDSFISPAQQRAEILRWAESQHVSIGEWHEDLDQSGGTMNRPAFNRMLERVKTGQTGGVIVAKVNRFARNLSEALDVIDEIDRAGGLFISAGDGGEFSTTSGRLHQRMLLSFAQFERESRSDAWAVSRERAINRGVHIGPVPIGYQKNHERRLIPDDQADYVRAAFEMRRNSRTLREIADWLNERTSPKRSKSFTPQTVAKMLANRIYLGEIRHGFTNDQAHEPLVDLGLFESAQTRPGPSVDTRSKYLLNGLIRCAGCRHSMERRHWNEKGRYRCRVHHASGKCEEPTRICEDDLTAQIIPAFLEHLATLPEAAGLIEVKHSLDMAQSTLLAFRDDLDAQRALGRRDWLDGLETRAEAVREAEKAFQAACAAKVGLDVPHVLKSWETAPTDDRRTWLRSAIDVVFVRPGETVEERTLILWHGSGPSDLPKAGAGHYVTTPYVW